MKILYAFPSVGNGHLARAQKLIAALKKHAQVDVLITGTNKHIAFSHPVRHHLRGVGLAFTKTGKVSIWRTLLQLRPWGIRKDIRTLPMHEYDLVVTDFEPISARAAKRAKVPCVHLSNQASFVSPKVPRPPRKNRLVEILFSQWYIPAQKYIGFHFQSYDEGVYTPLIGDEIRSADPTNNGRFVVYLNMYSLHELRDTFSTLPDYEFTIFSHAITKEEKQNNILFKPAEKEAFIEALTTAAGVITTAGFQTPAEALFLGKKLMVVPLASHYEQECNAAALEELGVMTLKKIDNSFPSHFQEWLESYAPIQLDYPEETEKIVQEILDTAN